MQILLSEILITWSFKKSLINFTDPTELESFLISVLHEL